jgi:hypothetical protein
MTQTVQLKKDILEFLAGHIERGGDICGIEVSPPGWAEQTQLPTRRNSPPSNGNGHIPRPVDDDRLLTMQEAADIIGCSKSHLDHHKEYPIYAMVGRLRKVSRPRLRKFIQELGNSGRRR